MRQRGMDRRCFLRLAGGAGAAAALHRSAPAAKASRRRPNFMVIMADDCSAREYGCYGNTKHRTPVLDRLAATGVRFRTCWCSPICSPTRAMIMTGRYAFRTQWWHNDMRPAANETNGDLSKHHRIFAQALRIAGYATAICGKWQLRGTEQAYGFDEHCMWRRWKGFDGPVEAESHPSPGRAARYWHPAIVRNGRGVPTAARDYGPDLFTDFALDFAKRNRDRPFLVYYPMCLTHVSWDFDAGRSGYLPVPELDAAGKPTGRKVAGSLKSNVEYADKLIGRICRGLEGLGLRDNTVIFYTCDNGTVGYGKNRADGERGPLVPMIVNAPGVVKPTGARDELVSLVDVFPTLLDLAGAALPGDYVLDGQSFAWALRGQKGRQREYVFCNLADKRLIRTKRWLLDGRGRLWDCGDNRTGEGYRDVTDSTDPQAVAAGKRLRKLLARLPGPDPDGPLVARYRQRQAKKRAARRSRKKRPRRSPKP